MNIEFLGPLYPVSHAAMVVFADLINSAFTANSVFDFSSLLIDLDRKEAISGYFQWNFDRKYFNLWQRSSYFSNNCFQKQILRIDISEFGRKDATDPLIFRLSLN